jgi:prepilin-type N-terminal cleavage/methylation domain-containing protein
MYFLGSRTAIMRCPLFSSPEEEKAFSLIELLVVIAIIVLVTAFIVPAFTSIKGGGDVTGAAYMIKGVLDQARTYAMSNNTYTWVGFYEEDASQSSTNPATQGNGRVVMSMVASKDGTTVYNPNSTTNPDPLDSTRLIQVGKLIKIENVHLAIFNDGLGTGETFDTRPAADTSFDQACLCTNTRSSRFGEINLTVPQSAPSTNTQFPFHYPLSTAFPGQYRFNKTLQFNPRGESSINSTYNVLRVLEVGLIPTRGTTAPTPTPSPGTYGGNVIAIQLTGYSGNIKVYRR